MKGYQVGYRTADGKVKYCHLSYEEGQNYNHLNSDNERTTFIKTIVDREKIQDALNRW